MSRETTERIWREHRSNWATLDSIRVPRVTRTLSRLIIAVLIIGALVLWFTPWVQTVSGRGDVTALSPQDRRQDVHALVGGRIEEWFVRNGSSVEEGDPIVRIADVDPLLVQRLRDERAAVERNVAAAGDRVATSVRDAERQQRLFEEGLASRLDMEKARIKVEDLRSQLAMAEANLQRIEGELARQSARTVRAPQAGTILSVASGDRATVVSRGERVATFVPKGVERAVRLYLSGRDAALVEAGRRVRLQFSGWPAVQFSGWPSVAVGTFGGRVAVVDRSADATGRFRVMVVPDPDAPPWPEDRFVRLGTRVQGWVLLETVRLGFELWRQMNNFPPQFQVPGGSGTGGAGGGGSGSGGSGG
ncbi:MAG: HlyD family efflux transporter periplasmic adaptor subunit [Chromatocurvus sp.]